MISKTILLLVWKIVESLKCIHTLKKKRYSQYKRPNLINGCASNINKIKH